MKTKFEDDNTFLRIQLLSYDCPTPQTERYYFLEMSTLQATAQLPPDKRIKDIKIVAYTENNKFLDDNTISTFRTIKDFNDFFINDLDYYIHECNLQVENGLTLSSHDDGEVSIQFSLGSEDETLIDRIFERYSLDKNLIELLKSKPGHYLSIDNKNNILADFSNFDDYIENRRK